MPKSIRLDPQLEDALDRATQMLDMTHSEFIREAVVKRCEEVLGQTLYDKLAQSVGVVRSSGGRARRTGAAFKQILGSRRK